MNSSFVTLGIQKLIRLKLDSIERSLSDMISLKLFLSNSAQIFVSKNITHSTLIFCIIVYLKYIKKGE